VKTQPRFWLKYVPAGVRELNDTGLYVKTEGEGKPLILIHGGPGLNHSYLTPHFDGLLDKFRLIYFDHRGAGRSSADLNKESMTFAIMIADIDAIHQHLGYETVSVLGHSFGALSAIQYALDYPAHIDKLDLINSVGGSMEFIDRYQQNLEARTTDEDRRERNQIPESEAMKENKPEAYRKLFNNTFKIQFYDRAKMSELNLWFPDDMAERHELLRHMGPELEIL